MNKYLYIKREFIHHPLKKWVWISSLFICVSSINGAATTKPLQSTNQKGSLTQAKGRKKELLEKIEEYTRNQEGFEEVKKCFIESVENSTIKDGDNFAKQFLSNAIDLSKVRNALSNYTYNNRGKPLLKKLECFFVALPSQKPLFNDLHNSEGIFKRAKYEVQDKYLDRIIDLINEKVEYVKTLSQDTMSQRDKVIIEGISLNKGNIDTIKRAQKTRRYDLVNEVYKKNKMINLAIKKMADKSVYNKFFRKIDEAKTKRRLKFKAAYNTNGNTYIPKDEEKNSAVCDYEEEVYEYDVFCDSFDKDNEGECLGLTVLVLTSLFLQDMLQLKRLSEEDIKSFEEVGLLTFQEIREVCANIAGNSSCYDKNDKEKNKKSLQFVRKMKQFQASQGFFPLMLQSWVCKHLVFIIVLPKR
ncbi:MAG: hypothetical protein AAF335_03225 [Bacteroidota bacterium]